MHVLLVVILAVILVLTLGCTLSADRIVAGKGILILKGATLIDGTGASPQPNITVVVSDDKIIYVGPPQGYNSPDQARVIDLAGRYLMPGFIDTHAHVTILGHSRRTDPVISENVLRTLLGFGITTVRNPAAPTEEGVGLRKAVAEGRLAGPRILTAGLFLNYGYTEGPSISVRSAADVREEVRRQAESGVDFIKVYASMPPHLISAAIDAAHERGLKVIGHLQTTDWTEAADAGIDYITHGASWSASYLPANRRGEYRRAIDSEGPIKARIDWLDWLDLKSPEIDEMITALVKNKVAVDPTLIAYETKFKGDDPAYKNNPELAFAPRSMVDSWREGTFTSDWSAADYRRGRAVWPKMLQLTRMYYDRGVLLMSGSDLPNPWVIPGVGYHRELELLVEAGIPPLAVLKIATRNGAEGLGVLDQVGTVEAGKQADLVILTANPVADIKNTRKIETVIQAGRVIKPEAMLKEK